LALLVSCFALADAHSNCYYDSSRTQLDENVYLTSHSHSIEQDPTPTESPAMHRTFIEDGKEMISRFAEQMDRLKYAFWVD